MKNSDWKDTAELIGIAAIVASLVFVGLQMRQSQEIAIADQYQARATMLLDYMNTSMATDLGNAWYTEQVIGPDAPDDLLEIAKTMSPEEFGHRQMAVEAALVRFDNMYFQYRSGFLSEETWQKQYGYLRNLLRFPRFRHAFRRGVSPEFDELCEQIIAEVEPAFLSQ